MKFSSKSLILYFIGQNNTGKSTFLRAYESFTNSKQKATLDDFYNQDITNTIKMEGWFELEKKMMIKINPIPNQTQTGLLSG